MYLILELQLTYGGDPSGCFSPLYTDDKIRVSKALQKGQRVFCLSNLNELKEIKLSFKESFKKLVTKEESK